MKVLIVIVGIFVAGAAGAAGAALFAPAPPAPAVTAVGPAPTSANVAVTPPEVERRMADMAMELADLRDEIQELRAQAARSPVVEVASAAPSTLTMPGGATPTPAQREQILQVLADQKAAEEAQREAERARREEENRLQRADRMAQRFGLNAVEESQLVGFYVQAESKFDEMRESMRLARESGTFDGEQMRAAMRDTRDWSVGELERLFGPVKGKEIAEYEQDRFRGFGGGGVGDGNRGGGRRGGNGGVPGG